MRFTKEGAVKFIGHLDTMRYFQKLMRRANIPIAYTSGMSPHQIMSFALPLGIGDESIGEYVDIELTELVKSTAALDSLRKAGIDEIRVLSFKELPEKALNAMASVEAADYEMVFEKLPCEDLRRDFQAFMDQNEITILKRTKKSEKYLDIKPFIFDYKISGDILACRLKCGSVDNTKPELVLEAFYAFCRKDFDPLNIRFKRLDLLTLVDKSLVSLDDIGKEI
ncbi:MAG: TIGR03936 family radical SAM-associated protein [Lachnospiraceae bacterium]|nr:TIGR03936 family radical SAM-associated protein [Lachnospiraceae bacterium]